MRVFQLVTFAAGAFALTLPGAAVAQASTTQAAAKAPQLKLSKAEQPALKALLDAASVATAARAAGQTPDWAKVRALLPAAQAVARSNDARYLVAKVELNLAIAANDVAAQERLVNQLLASPTATAAEKAE